MSALPQSAVPLDHLYEQDETAWLEATADLVSRGRYEELDAAHLSEYLTDMAVRDRREVYSRLLVLLAQLLAASAHEGPPHAGRRVPPRHRGRSGRLTRRESLSGRRPRG